MAWIIGQKSDESVLEISMKLPDFTLTELETIVPAKLGGVAGDYSFFHMDATDEARIKDGWDYDIVWTTNEITDIDFSPEENKRWVKFTADKTEIDDDGVDSVEIIMEIWDKDLTGIETGISTTSSVPILTPSGEKWTKASIVNGIRTKNFTTTKSGTWVFPSRSNRFKNVRVFNQIVLTVIETDIL